MRCMLRPNESLPTYLESHGDMLASVLPGLLDGEGHFLDALGEYKPVQQTVAGLLENCPRSNFDEDTRQAMDIHQRKTATLRKIFHEPAHMPRATLRLNGLEPAYALLGDMLCPARTGLELVQRLNYMQLAQHDVLKRWMDVVDEKKMFRQVCAGAPLPPKDALQVYAGYTASADRATFQWSHPPKFDPLRGLTEIQDIVDK